MQKKRSIAALIVACFGVGFLLLGVNEPSPGLHDWFHRLAMDWAIRIGDTGYEIGNSLGSEERGHFRVFHWVAPSRKDGSEGEGCAPETLIDRVLSFQSLDKWILVQTSTGWGAIHIPTGNVHEAADIKGLAGSVPDSVIAASDSMIAPRPSYRVRYFVLCGVLAVTSVILLIRGVLPKRCRKTGDIVIAKRSSDR